MVHSFICLREGCGRDSLVPFRRRIIINEFPALRPWVRSASESSECRIPDRIRAPLSSAVPFPVYAAVSLGVGRAHKVLFTTSRATRHCGGEPSRRKHDVVLTSSRSPRRRSRSNNLPLSLPLNIPVTPFIFEICCAIPLRESPSATNAMRIRASTVLLANESCNPKVLLLNEIQARGAQTNS